jgi:hypothetical protein
MKITHKTLYLHKWNFVQEMIMNMLKTFISIYALFDEAFKNGDGSKFWGYFGTDTELICVECFNFVQFRVLLAYHL